MAVSPAPGALTVRRASPALSPRTILAAVSIRATVVSDRPHWSGASATVDESAATACTPTGAVPPTARVTRVSRDTRTRCATGRCTLTTMVMSGYRAFCARIVAVPAATAKTTGATGETRTFDVSDETNWNIPTGLISRSCAGTNIARLSVVLGLMDRAWSLNRTLSFRTSTAICFGCQPVLPGTVARTTARPVSPGAATTPTESTDAIRSPPGSTVNTMHTGSEGWPSARAA
jgi:hypothetical protein